MSVPIQIKDYKAGTAVIIQNAVNPGYFCVVRKGVLVIDSEHRLAEKVLSRFEIGDSFGLVSALTGHRFLVTVYAQTDAQVAEIPVAMVGSYLKSQPEVALKMLRLYSRELRTLQMYLSAASTAEERVMNTDTLYFRALTYLEWNKSHYAAHALERFLSQGANSAYFKPAKDALAKCKEDLRQYQFGNKSKLIPADTLIFSEGETGQEIYVVISGSVKLFRIVRGNEFIIDVQGPGELFGEMAFIENVPRMGSAVTVGESNIIRISPNNLIESVGESILQKIFENMARRIWFAHQRLIILKISDPIVRLYAYLYNLMRNQSMRVRDKDLQDQSYRFELTVDDLKRMCGILRMKEATEQQFRTNPNLIITPHDITIKNRKRLEDQIAYYKAKSGQIISESM